MVSSNSKLILRLVIQNDKLLFAEASKPVVDFLFYILCLPMASVIKLLANNGMVGSIGNVYHSVKDLQVYMLHEQSKDSLLNPIASISFDEFYNLLPMRDENEVSSTSSSEISNFILVDTENDEEDENDDKVDVQNDEVDKSDEEYKNDGELDIKDDKVDKNHEEENANTTNNGIVKDVCWFLVMDDLVIQPITSIIDIVLKYKIHPKQVRTIDVEFGINEGIKLLRASLQTKKVLTSVFINKEFDM
ncbi:uncharacterized protein LOC131634597 [Vicia villosa]|uniref:uncharacterized protein LOC131634597 n=1 Tax=Vicia villosa TaxID=3911 RepID=UPI00273B9E84|nr:uncharacterized protein LOC131634597 [Vicia villosa]